MNKNVPSENQISWDRTSALTLKDVVTHMQAKAPTGRLPTDTANRLDSPASTIRTAGPGPQIKVGDHQSQRGEWLAPADSPLSIIPQAQSFCF